jgi:MFS family permease
MSLLVPDILEEALGLSLAFSITGLVLGLFLWLYGWRGHRFWIVLAATVSAGVGGLMIGPSYGASPVAAGLLLAVAAGVLALALARLVVFVAAGVAGWTAVHALVPTWNEPLVCFLVCGLIGLLLFRLWTMALTSFAGALLMAYSCLCLLERFAKLDVVTLAKNQAVGLNWTCAGLTLLGMLVQFLLERRRKRPAPKARERPKPAPRKREEPPPPDEGKKGWLSAGWKLLRRAG